MSTWMQGRVPRFAEAAVERARLSVVPRAATRRAARLPFVALVSLLLVGGVAGLLFLNTHMQQVSFTATALEQQAQLLDAQRQSLQMQTDALRDPQRVAVRAKRMGMVPAASPAFLRLADGTVLGSATPATVDDAFRIGPPPVEKPRDLNPRPVIKRLKHVRPATGGATGAADTLGAAPAGTKSSTSQAATEGNQR